MTEHVCCERTFEESPEAALDCPCIDCHGTFVIVALPKVPKSVLRARRKRERQAKRKGRS